MREKLTPDQWPQSAALLPTPHSFPAATRMTNTSATDFSRLHWAKGGGLLAWLGGVWAAIVAWVKGLFG